MALQTDRAENRQGCENSEIPVEASCGCQGALHSPTQSSDFEVTATLEKEEKHNGVYLQLMEPGPSSSFPGNSFLFLVTVLQAAAANWPIFLIRKLALGPSKCR